MFVKLNKIEEEGTNEIVVNVMNILYMRRVNAEMTMVFFVAGSSTVVKESPDEIVTRSGNDLF